MSFGKFFQTFDFVIFYWFFIWSRYRRKLRICSFCSFQSWKKFSSTLDLYKRGAYQLDTFREQSKSNISISDSRALDRIEIKQQYQFIGYMRRKLYKLVNYSWERYNVSEWVGERAPTYIATYMNNGDFNFAKIQKHVEFGIINFTPFLVGWSLVAFSHHKNYIRQLICCRYKSSEVFWYIITRFSH